MLCLLKTVIMVLSLKTVKEGWLKKIYPVFAGVSDEFSVVIEQ